MIGVDGSASSIIAISRSKSRYTQQDQLLRAFVSLPRSTAKEVAVEALDWRYEKYCSAPKRAADLASKKLGYLEVIGNRECRQTGADAHAYQITERGLAYLSKHGLLNKPPNVVSSTQVVPKVDVHHQCKSLLKTLRD